MVREIKAREQGYLETGTLNFQLGLKAVLLSKLWEIIRGKPSIKPIH